MLNKIVIVSPHPDDEVYGCSSWLGRDIVIVYVTNFHPLWTDKNREENIRLVNRLGCKAVYFPSEKYTNRLKEYGIGKLIGHLEELFNQANAETVLIPAPSYNQDHRLVYDACLTALRRHDKNIFAKRILVYEEPDTFDTLRRPEPFKPNYYRHLDMTFKNELILIYESQIRGHRTIDQIETIARLRGIQANMDYAEAFEVLRWID